MRPIDADDLKTKLCHIADMIPNPKDQGPYILMALFLDNVVEVPTIDVESELKSRLQEVVQSLGMQLPLLTKREYDLYQKLKELIE